MCELELLLSASLLVALVPCKLKAGGGPSLCCMLTLTPVRAGGTDTASFLPTTTRISLLNVSASAPADLRSRASAFVSSGFALSPAAGACCVVVKAVCSASLASPSWSNLHWVHRWFVCLFHSDICSALRSLIVDSLHSFTIARALLSISLSCCIMSACSCGISDGIATCGGD